MKLESKKIAALLKICCAAWVVGVTALPQVASAASDWTGKIGRLDLRTGYADTYDGTDHSQHDIVVRSSSATAGNIVCVIEAGTVYQDEFLSVATAAMLSGASVTITRGGAAQGQFKCASISIAP